MEVKFRSEAPFGEGYRNPAEVMAHETFELGNTDILDYMLDHYLKGDIRNNAYSYADELSNNGFIDDMSFEDMQEFFRECLKQIKAETGKDIQYVLWLAEETTVREFYCQNLNTEDYDVDAYDVSDAIVLSDIGYDGKLYGYEKEPERIKEKSNYDNRSKEKRIREGNRNPTYNVDVECENVKMMVKKVVDATILKI